MTDKCVQDSYDFVEYIDYVPIRSNTVEEYEEQSGEVTTTSRADKEKCFDKDVTVCGNIYIDEYWNAAIHEEEFVDEHSNEHRSGFKCTQLEDNEVPCHV